MSTEEVEEAFVVVINEEEQYAIWPAALSVPDGWAEVGFSGSKSACAEHVDAVWTDMRPLSLRRHMAAQQA